MAGTEASTTLRACVTAAVGAGVRVASAPGIHSRERPACTRKVGAADGSTAGLHRFAASASRSPATIVHPKDGSTLVRHSGPGLTADGRELPIARCLRIALRPAFHGDNSMADPPAFSADLPPSPRVREDFISAEDTRRRGLAQDAPTDSTSAAGMHRKALAEARVSVAATAAESITAKRPNPISSQALLPVDVRKAAARAYPSSRVMTFVIAPGPSRIAAAQPRS